jgi:plasmid stability protein
MMLMGQLLVRKLDDDLIRRLKQRAAAAGRSVEAEHRAILEATLRRPGAADFAERAKRLRARTGGRKTSDSAELVRADRDRDLTKSPEITRS